MQISYYGLSCFRFVLKPGGRATDEIVLYVDPLNEKGVRSVYGKADIVLCSQGEGGCSGKIFKREVKIFDIPGEYSVQGIDIFGIVASYEERVNTLFLFQSENIRVAHLGRICRKLNEKELEKLERVDILLIPVGGNDFLNAESAAEIVRTVEPKIVIPMMYSTPGNPYNLQEVDKFFSEMGIDKPQETDKFICKEKDLPEKGVRVIFLASQR